MIADVDTGEFQFVQRQLRDYRALTQRATAESVKSESETAETNNERGHKRELPLIVLYTGRGLCWCLAIVCFCTYAFLSVLRWTGTWSAPAGVTTWFTVGMALFIISAHAIRASIQHRQMLALAETIRAELRTEIRDHAPADAIELARIATMVERVWAAVAKQEERLAGLRSDLGSLMLMKADAERFVDARSEAEEGRAGGVASVTHLPVVSRSPSPRKGDHS